MENRRDWVLELAIVMGLIVAFALAVVLISCCACGSERREVADWVWVLLQYGIAGAFGGCLTHLAQSMPSMEGRSPTDSASPPNESSDRKLNRDYRFLSTGWGLAIFVNCMGGVGASYAVLFFLAQADKMKELSMESPTILKNIVTGIVSGFLGFPLLRRISESADGLLGKARMAGEQAGRAVAERIEEKTKQSIETAKTDVMQTQKDVEESIERRMEVAAKESNRISLDNAINLGLQAFRAWQAKRKPRKEFPDFEPPEYREAKARLEEVRQYALDNRMAAIINANLYYMKRDFQKAIEAISPTIEHLQKKTTAKDALLNEHIGDMLFNRAGYAIRQMEMKPEEKQSLLVRIVADLRECFQRTPTNFAEVKTDPDFKTFRTLPEYASLLAEFDKK